MTVKISFKMELLDVDDCTGCPLLTETLYYKHDSSYRHGVANTDYAESSCYLNLFRAGLTKSLEHKKRPSKCKTKFPII